MPCHQVPLAGLTDVPSPQNLGRYSSFMPQSIPGCQPFSAVIDLGEHRCISSPVPL
jgi:hypothetical protein